MTFRTYFIKTPLSVQTHFTFVEVFREATQYSRIYNLPFNSVCVCTRENQENPSTAENLDTGTLYTFHKNDVTLMPRNIPHRYIYTMANEHLCIHFRLEIFPGADVFAGKKERKVLNSIPLRRECERIFREKDPILKLAGCQEFALKICRMHWPEKYGFDLESMKKFEPVLRRIRDGVSAETQISELAGLLGYSEDYFTRSFRSVFGESPKQYLQKELFSRAAQLLSNPAMNVKTAAAELGFSSEFYFSKFFKRLSGVSPSEYRTHSKEILQIGK